MSGMTIATLVVGAAFIFAAMCLGLKMVLTHDGDKFIAMSGLGLCILAAVATVAWVFKFKGLW